MGLVKGASRCAHFGEAISCRGTGAGIARRGETFKRRLRCKYLFAIGSGLLLVDDNGVDSVISYQSRLLKAAELNYPVHDKEIF